MKKIISIVIVGKRWLDKVNGNTYFSAIGLIDGEIKAQIEFEYGYEDHYVWQIFRELEKSGKLTNVNHYKNGGCESPHEYCSRNGIKFYYSASDVCRKKDL